MHAGPLTWLIATPEFHHWHHANHHEAYNKNYAGQLPVVDWMFRSVYLPRLSWPESYGCDAVAPRGYLSQLAWPFVPFRRRTLVGIDPVERAAKERRSSAADN